MAYPSRVLYDGHRDFKLFDLLHDEYLHAINLLLLPHLNTLSVMISYLRVSHPTTPSRPHYA